MLQENHTHTHTQKEQKTEQKAQTAISTQLRALTCISEK